MQKVHLMTTSALNDGVLSVADSLLWDELSNRNLSGLIFNPNEVNIECRSNIHLMYVKDQPLPSNGLLLVRLMRNASDRAYSVAKMYESIGGKVSDPVSSLGHAGSKLLPFIQRRGVIEQVPTFFFHKGMAVFRQITDVVSLPFIIKPHFGSRGVGVALINDQVQFDDYLKNSDVDEFVAQQLLENVLEEYRAVVVGGKSIGVVRKNRPKDSESFLGEDDRDEYVTDEEVSRFAEQVAEVSDGDVYGADIIRLRTGDLYLIENNRCPDFTTFREATGIPVEKIIVDFLEEKYLNH
jgi:glutathione synthase/RimK-type ligase-like ATP-grasp enzyme